MLRRAGRFVLKLQKYDTVKHEMSAELKWLFPDYMYQYELLNLAYSIFIKSWPPYFNNYLDFTYIPIRVTRNRTYYTNSASRLNSAYGYKTFKFNATALWLNLPLDYDPLISELLCGQGSVPDQNCAIPNSMSMFKRHLKQIYLDKQTEESAPREEDVFNYSCIESVVNFVLEDS